jgi:hypothetical protein
VGLFGDVVQCTQDHVHAASQQLGNKTCS